jgi:EmrB/QacA subfamily drug resistance transporter
MSTVALNSREGRWIMASTIIASAMAFIDGTALNVVLPALQDSLRASGAALFWILNAYLLMLAALILIGGALGDRLGRKKVFMAGILIFIIGSALCGFAPDVWFLILFRVIQGIGGAFMIPGSLSLLSSSINESERGRAIGTWSSVTTMVTLGGPLLGGALADAGLWRWIFFINVPIGIAALIILAGKVEERSGGKAKGIDIPGALSIAAGLSLITFGFLRIPEMGFGHWQAWGSLAAGLVCLGIFLAIESCSEEPMMPLSLFRNTAFSGANLLTFFLYAGLGTGMLFLSLNLVQIQGYTQLQSGLSFLPFTLLMILLARYAGNLADKHGPRLFLIAGPFAAGAGLLWLSFAGQTGGPGTYWTSFFPGIMVFGLGMACTVAPLTATVMGAVSDRHSGTASGVNNAVTRISNVFANAIFGALAAVFFATALQHSLRSASIPASQQIAIVQQASGLGNAKVPQGVTGALATQIKTMYHEAFLGAYHRIMLCAAALCWLGALMSMLFIRNSAIGRQADPGLSGKA